MFQKFFSPCVSDSSGDRNAMSKYTKDKSKIMHTRGRNLSHPDLIQNTDNVDHSKSYNQEYVPMQANPQFMPWFKQSGYRIQQEETTQPVPSMSTFKTNLPSSIPPKEDHPINANDYSQSTQMTHHKMTGSSQDSDRTSVRNDTPVLENNNAQKPYAPNVTTKRIPDRNSIGFPHNLTRETSNHRYTYDNQKRDNPNRGSFLNKSTNDLHRDRYYNPNVQSMSSSYHNLSNVEPTVRVRHQRSNSDSNILDDKTSSYPVARNNQTRQTRQTPRSVKRKKRRRRKTYSSVEDMLDWDMHTDTSDAELFSQDGSYQAKHQSPLPNHSTPVNLSNSYNTYDEDSSVFEDYSDSNSNTQKKKSTKPHSDKYSGYVTDVESSCSSFSEYNHPVLSDDYKFDGHMAADSMFSLRDVGSSPNHMHQTNGMRNRRSAFVQRNQYETDQTESYHLNRMSSTQSFVQRYVQNHDLSDVLLNSDDLRVLNRLCSGRNFAVCSACLKRRNTNSRLSSYFVPVCVQKFQGLNNNADRINFLQNAAELRQLKHRHILEVFGVCIEGKDSSSNLARQSTSSIMMMVTEATHHMVNLQSLLTRCEENNPQLLTEQCLLTFAQEICWGLTYLSSQGIIHNNLTTSTVMLDTFCVIKLSGLEPHNIKQRCAPYRWVAIESHNGIVTDASTTWSLGVMLWAMMTLGEKPYSHLKTAGEIYSYLMQGKRLDKPSDCSDILYEWMCACWRPNQSDRPQIDHIIRFLDSYRKSLPQSKSPQELFPNEDHFWIL